MSEIPTRERAKVYERSERQCEIRLQGTCVGLANQIHHLFNGNDRRHHHRAEELVDCCAHCHEAVTTHRIGTEAFRFSETDTAERRAYKMARVLATRGDGDKYQTFGRKA